MSVNPFKTRGGNGWIGLCLFKTRGGNGWAGSGVNIFYSFRFSFRKTKTKPKLVQTC